MKDLVIVGAGQSAAQCVLTLKRNNFEESIVVVGEEDHLPYQRPPLSKDYLSGEAGLDRVYMKTQDFYDQNNVTVKVSTKVLSLDRKEKMVHLSKGEALPYENLVLATGSRVRQLEVEGSDLKNINYLRSINDSNNLKDQFQKGKSLVIIGAGYIGLEVAAAAVKKGLKVTVVEMEDRVMSRTVDPIISEYFDTLHRNKGVKIIEEAWKKKYPNVAKKVDDLEHRIKNLEQINLF